MAKINLLDKHVAELIAAGEVVERPASVVKELVENSIDAGATSVTVEIKNGGTTYIRVTDNGCGIVREDVPTAFLRHATSKVLNPDDLESIATLGFRGEALASVAAVAHVELLTRTAQELAGTRYVIEGGQEQCCEDAGCPQGTTLVVRDIFYNTPARMKFLKKDTVESNAIAAVLDKIALSHPEVSFRFLRDGKETLHTPGDGKLKSAIFAVFGKEFTAGLIPLEYECGGVKVSGFISKPSSARPNRSMQQFFINGRYVRSRTAMVALEEGFKGSLMVGKFPACILHLTMSYQAVDVNVHPAKLEVRFINERPIFDAVYHGVKTALSRGDAPPVINFPASQKSVLEEKPAEQLKLPLRQREDPVQLPGVFSRTVASQPMLRDSGAVIPPKSEDDGVDIFIPSVSAYRVAHQGFPSEMQANFRPQSPLPDSDEKLEISASEEKEPEPDSRKIFAPIDACDASTSQPPLQDQPVRLIGEAFGTYIILERGREELLFIDKHAAHERMLYEKLKAESGAAFSQMLLEPIAVTLDKNECSAVLNALDICAKAGFEIEDFGAGTVLVRSAPLSLGKEDVASAVMEIAGYLASSKTDVTTGHLDWLYHNIACRAAVKAHDESSPRELLDLVRRLEENPEIRYCPHGRPVSIIVKKRELEKQFGRIQ